MPTSTIREALLRLWTTTRHGSRARTLLSMHWSHRERQSHELYLGHMRTGYLRRRADRANPLYENHAQRRKTAACYHGRRKGDRDKVLKVLMDPQLRMLYMSTATSMMDYAAPVRYKPGQQENAEIRGMLDRAQRTRAGRITSAFRMVSTSIRVLLEAYVEEIGQAGREGPKN